MKIGQHGVYHVPDTHQVGAAGSIHHAEMRDFFGTVGRVQPDGSVDVGYLVPGHGNVRWAQNVPVGSAPGQFEPEGSEAEAPAPEAAPAPETLN